MKWNSRPNLSRHAVAIALLVATTGCYPWPNVFVDDLPTPDMITTSSADRAYEIGGEETPRIREYELFVVEGADGTVSHAPLYFEDPFEMSGSEDGQFAITSDEILVWAYDLLRFGVNLGLSPVSMIVDPPTAVMCSDGVQRLSRESWLKEPYDAERCNGVSVPYDIHETWTHVAMADAEIQDERVPTPDDDMSLDSDAPATSEDMDDSNAAEDVTESPE